MMMEFWYALGIFRPAYPRGVQGPIFLYRKGFAAICIRRGADWYACGTPIGKRLEAEARRRLLDI